MTQANLTLRGGAEMVVLKIAQHYKARIYTAEYNKEGTFPEFADLDVEVIGRKGLALLPYGRVVQGLNYGLSFYNLKLEDDYDVINAHVAPSHWVRNNNERVLWYCHTPLRDLYDLYQFRMAMKKPYQRPLHMIGLNFVRRIDRKMVSKIELILANSKNTRSRIRTYLGREAKVLNGGIEYKEYANGSDEKYFLYPSRFSPNKRQLFAIKAFKEFRRMSRPGNYKLVLAGALSGDRFYSDYYAKVVEEAKKIKGISVLPNIDDDKLKRLFSHATAVLYPPINEDYGLTPLQAMASGKPVIAVNEGGPKETVVDGKTGFLVNDEKEMAAKMRFIAEHPSTAEEIGRAGIARVREHYSWDRFFETFDKALNRVKKM